MPPKNVGASGMAGCSPMCDVRKKERMKSEKEEIHKYTDTK